MARKIEIELIGDASSLQRAFKQSGRDAQGFGSGLAKLGKVAAVAAGAAGIAAVALTLKAGISEFNEAAKVSAQTASVLKSTGGVANVTAKDVGRLSEALMRQSGIDDELIQSGSNLILTFKNIRNEVGQGNAVFDRATKAALDLSVAGFGSMESTSKTLGKALNDPIKGLSALSRAGVTFTQGQKDQIAAMVEAGNVLGAQKLILGELESQVGGSAKALGDTLPGQVNKLKETFSNLAGELIAKAVPALTRLVDFGTTHMPTMQAAMAAVATAVGQFVSALTTLGPVLGGVVGFMREHETLSLAVAGAIGGVVVGLIALRTALATAAAVQAAFNLVVAANPYVALDIAIAAAVGALVVLYQRSETVRNVIDQLGRAVVATGRFIVEHWNTISTVVSTAAIVITTSVRLVIAAIQAIMPVIAAVIDAVETMVAAFKVAAQAIITAFETAWRWLREQSLVTVRAVIEPFSHLPREAGAWARDMKVEIDRELSKLRESGRKGAQGVIAGIDEAKDQASASGRALGSSLRPGSRAASTASPGRWRPRSTASSPPPRQLLAAAGACIPPQRCGRRASASRSAKA